MQAITVAPGPFLAIVGAAAIAAAIATTVKLGGLSVPVVVLELVLGVVLGPKLLGIQVTSFISFFADIGLGLLFFFAGYEINLEAVKGPPLRLAALGWIMSLAIAYAVGGLLAATGLVISLLYTGSALVSTALGVLIPTLSDAGELRSKLGTYALAAGAVGEFGPVLLMTLVLSAQSTLHNALILIAFVAAAVGVAVFALRSSGLAIPHFTRSMDSASQPAVRWVLLLIFGLATLAHQLGLDLLLGGFAAGMITRLAFKEDLPALDVKLKAISFGAFVPFFFVVSGMRLDVSALTHPAGLAKLVLFLAMMLLVRGTPALLLYRRVLDGRQRLALALLTSTQLPLVVAITDLAVGEGHMRPSTAASLVGAAAVSTLVMPLAGLKLETGARRG